MCAGDDGNLRQANGQVHPGEGDAKESDPQHPLRRRDWQFWEFFHVEGHAEIKTEVSRLRFEDSLLEKKPNECEPAHELSETIPGPNRGYREW